MLYLRALLFAVAVPGTVTVVIPWSLVRGRTPFEVGALSILGLPLVVAGAAALLWCIWDFARTGRGTLAPVDPPRALVRRGLYAHVRNPMYVGVVTTLLGEALFTGVAAIAGLAATMALVFHMFVLGYEEPTLRRVFGASYEDYCRAVPRWLPRWTPAPRE
ncbi:MAG TPA: isoprenylcysteine carboxylmethyltransferase family protein [Kofleriaceae bacterium]|nr:isoprenylcysteine carboxylmethyltransferase family protein [Kofleriaceae bacterium]